MIETKFEKLIQYLKDQNIRIDRLVPDSLKCIICEDILICAVQTLCGCRFCPQCMDRLIENGILFCPGTKEECKFELLKSDRKSHLNGCANETLSKLIIECPKIMCSFECSLENIEQHMEICGQQKIKCPYRKMGCTKKWITRDRMRYHLFWHKENRSDLWLTNTFRKDVGNSVESVGNIFTEIERIKADLNKIDTLNQIHRKEFQVQITNLKIEFQSNLNKVASEIDALKQVQKSTINSQFLQEFQDKLKSKVNPSNTVCDIQTKLPPVLENSKCDVELPDVLKNGKIQPTKADEAVIETKNDKPLKKKSSSTLVKPNMWNRFIFFYKLKKKTKLNNIMKPRRN